MSASSRKLVAKPLAQVEDRFGVDLARAALCHSEDLADLGEVQALVVVQGEHFALAFVEALDGLGKLASGFLELDRCARGVALVLEGLSKSLAAAAALAEQDVVELQQAWLLDVWRKMSSRSLVDISSSSASSRSVGERPRVPSSFENAVSTARAFARTERGPIDGTQLVQDGPRDRGARHRSRT